MLKQLAKHYINRDISNYCFVFPNHRAGLFFRKYLEESATHTLILPEIITIAELFQLYSKYRIADKLVLLFELYRVYCKVMADNGKAADGFDEFASFGETLLADFNDIDCYQIDAKRLFTNIDDLQKLSDDEYLTDSQKEVLSNLFNYQQSNKTVHRDTFKSIWSMLLPIYEGLKEILKEKGLAYTGMQYRDVVEASDGNLETDFDKIIFVGFNALDEVERSIFKAFGVKAEFYWDYKLPYLDDKQNLAGYFATDNQSRFSTKEQLENETFPSDTKFYNIVTPSMTAQTIEARKILQELGANDINTVIVLLDEHLLLPMLFALPIEKGVNEDESKKIPINVTMGFPISHTTVLDFIEEFILLQNTADNDGFYHKHTLSLLSHPYIQKINNDTIVDLRQQILKDNKVKIPYNFFDNTESDLLKKVFTRYANADILQAAIDIASEVETDNDYDGECLSQVLLSLNYINRLIKEYGMEMEPITLLRTIRQSTQSISVSFKGEPLNGLQIMGTLETRCLNFDNVIFLSFNEGIFPKSGQKDSIIPYSLRKASNLPTTEHQDAVYAYNFYRLISRAKRVYMISDCRTENMKTGEPSRYLKQLKYIYDKEVKEIVSVGDITVNQNISEMPKPDDWVSKLLGGDIKLSASSIAKYLQCQWMFYIQTYLKIYEEEDISEVMEANDLGIIFHKAIQKIYTDMQNGMHGGDITKNAIEQMLKNDAALERYIVSAFKSEYFHLSEDKHVDIKGVNALMSKLILNYIKHTLKEDMKKVPFKVFNCEYYCEALYYIYNNTLFANKPIHLKGTIDRLDTYIDSNGKTILRVIDYKTGKKKIDSKKALKDASNDTQRQLLFYKYLIQNSTKKLNVKFDDIELNVYELGALNSEDNQTKVSADNYPMFSELMDEILSDMLNQDTGIKKTTDTYNTCKFCSFSNLCNRITTP
ncbi:MAG: PD-(D/E)XK nuclease family protein [Paludibacteraceae bacterium]|nr:PD-(D/E)XK nuclease family protein [Paludibacteraceae bacterium]